jgi:hypothetical protein
MVNNPNPIVSIVLEDLLRIPRYVWRKVRHFDKINSPLPYRTRMNIELVFNAAIWYSYSIFIELIHLEMLARSR